MDLVRKEGTGDGSGCSRRKEIINGVPAPFLVKTHQMVEEGGTDDVISWGETGKSFIVWKPAEFARDLLPAHFKHNNFSSFVRQLNTYGFRKMVPDRWEFANDKFQRGEQRLLNEIHRRKALPALTSAKSKCSKNNTPVPSTSNSGELQTSSSTSSPPPPSQHYLNLSDENKKLRKDNHILHAELLQAKKQCEELLCFLSKNVSINELDVSLIIKEAERIGVEIAREGCDNGEEDDAGNGIEEEGEKVACLKLFGVLLKEFEGEKGASSRGKKRGRCEEHGGERAMKMGLRAPWVSSKVCN